jgi:DNA-binding NarL/FixJ family response regulator
MITPQLPEHALPAAAATRVVIADDHDVVRSGLRALLARIPGVEVVGEAGDGEELLAAVEALQPDIVMTDITMPVLDGIAAVHAIHERHPGVRCIVLSMHEDIALVRQAVEKGACGYLMKNAPWAEVEHAIRTVRATGSYFSGAIAHRLLQDSTSSLAHAGELTDRQVEVLTLLAGGSGTKQIAFELGLSPKTVDTHRARIMERLGLKEVASLTRYAVRSGLVKA